jgi:HK97 family phage major capsid protein
MRLLDKLQQERQDAEQNRSAILDVCAEETRDLTEAEDSNVGELTRSITALDERISQLAEIQVSDLEAQKLRAEMKAADDVPTHNRAIIDGPVSVTEEPRTYSEHAKDRSFFTDIYNMTFNQDVGAGERIQRHQREEEIENRDGTTTNYSGLVVPQYITSLAAELARAQRPFADQCTRLPLPDNGLSIEISRVTTGSSAAVQATENSAVSETDIDDTLLSSPIRTIASGQQVSRQVLERGTGTDALIMADMQAAMATTLDSQLISGTGSSGQLTGINAVSGTNAITYTDGSPTAAELWPKLIDAVQQINSNRFAGPDLIVMHPRRAAFLMAALDGQSRPLVVPQANAPQNAQGVGPVAGYGATGLTVAGIPVIQDGNVPTDNGSGSNEDIIYVVRRADMLLFEDAAAPAMVRMDQTSGTTLTVTIVGYNYCGFVAGRYPKAISKISGTGLTPPSF